MKPTTITNPVVYTTPDFDSDYESDSEYKSMPYVPSTQFLSEKQRYNLIKLGCVYNPLDDYRNMDLFKSGKNFDEQSRLKKLEHAMKIKRDNTLYIKQQQEKRREEFKAAQAALAELNLQDEKEKFNDEAFFAELKKQEQRVEAAVAYDKKKLADATAKLEKEKEETEKAQQEKERKQKALKEKKQELAKAQSSATSQAGLEEYNKYFAKIEHYRTNIRPLLQKDDFRKQCFSLKRHVKRTVSQLQSKHEVVLQKYTFLHQLLVDTKRQSNEAFHVMLNDLAKLLVDQVKQDVHMKENAAYFLGRFAYLMCSTVPEFLDYLMGRLLKRCQYLIPRYHDDDETLSHDEIRSRLRYVYKDKGKKQLENFMEHAESQHCYVMFYGALCQTLPDPGQPENPFPISHAWIWLARICNMPPREITPILVSGFLEVTAKRLLEAYPNQTPKLLRLLRDEVCPSYIPISNVDNKASISRIEMFLDDYFNKGQVNALPEEIELSR